MHPRALMWGNPPSTTSTRLYLASSLTVSQLPFLPFSKQNKGKEAKILWECSAPQPTHPHGITPQTISTLIQRQGKLHTAPRHFASPRAAGIMSPLGFAKPFLHSLTLFFLWYFWDGRGDGHATASPHPVDQGGEGSPDNWVGGGGRGGD